MKPDKIADLGLLTTEALCDPHADVREATLARLAEFYVSCEAGTCTTNSAVAQAALPYAKRAFVDPNPEIRVTGARAIGLFAVDAEGSIPDLARALTDPEAVVRVAALEALTEFGARAALSAPQVAERLANAPSPEERSAAAYTLGNIGAQADHLDVLLDALLHDIPAVQAGAAHALALALEAEREETRMRVSRALHRLSRAT